MMSLRILSRSVPRTSLRLATNYSTRTSTFTPALHAAVRQQHPRIIAPRCFSTSLCRRDDSAQELAAKLNQEIQLETEENATPAESNSNIDAFTSQNPHWEIVDNEGEQEVLLKRKYEDEDITVSFSIEDFNTPFPENEDPDEALMDEEDELGDAQSGGANTKGAINQGRTSGGNIKVAPEDSVAPGDREGLRDPEDEQDGQPAFPANVNVLVQRKGKGALRIHLIADNGVWTIQNVTHLPDSRTTNAKTVSELLNDQSETLYTGPPFQQLDEEVQGLLETYLDVRGINTGLALFVPEYIDVKEQKEYLGWLKRVREFVE
ncbi:MAM33, mitochondrial matrix glycoprotein [Teratosphaeria destructans]|uniref:MAM33, mitochondrial matrix glycoprotein n=1 Tax=Teratosphaeria destructans TaxID=418781 RepID=A0A9W7T0Q6_9PEZI|nr:MAM33, mitochondrial matrix glycoprotein [Teratosphaeria destructans]